MADYLTHFSCLLDVGTSEKALRAIDFFVELRGEDILGVSLKTQTVRLMGGGTGRSPAFGSPGFRHKGMVRRSRPRPNTPRGATREIRAYAPTDQALHNIADRLQAAQRQNFYQLSADVTHRGATTANTA